MSVYDKAEKAKAKPKETKKSPDKKEVSRWVKLLIERGKLPSIKLPFPRMDRETGEPVCDVIIQVLDQKDEDDCLANAALYAERILNQTIKDENNLPDEVKHWARDDLKHNAICSEIMLKACRDPEDPSKPFFEMPAEVRMFTKDELGQLMSAYGNLCQDTYKSIPLDAQEDVETFIHAISRGLEDTDPFFRYSRETLVACLLSVIRYCVEKDPDTFKLI